MVNKIRNKVLKIKKLTKNSAGRLGGVGKFPGRPRDSERKLKKFLWK